MQNKANQKCLQEEIDQEKVDKEKTVQENYYK